MIDFAAESAHDALQLEEVEDELVRGIELPVNGNACAVIVPVEPLAPVTGIGNEVGGGEDQVVSGH